MGTRKRLDKDTPEPDKRPVIDIYARLSFAMDGSTVNVEDQMEMGTETIEDRGAVVGEVFTDNSKSAWNPKVVRPDWNRMMERLESGDSDGVWVYDSFRFSRKVIEGERLVKAADRGIRVWSYSGEYDLQTADGRRHFREDMVAAAAESDKISERVRRGKLRRARKGRRHGGARAFAEDGWLPKPEGWEPGDPRDPAPPELVEAEREIVRECYQRLLAGEHVSTLVWDLNQRELYNQHGRPWRRSGLVRTLRRAKLAGLNMHRKEILGELAGVEPVVSVEDWTRLCAILDGRKRGRPAGQVSGHGSETGARYRVHWLSGLPGCGRCGTPGMTGVPRPVSTPYPDGSPKREYRCRRDPDGGKPGCGRNHIDARVAEEAVGQAVIRRLGDPRRADRIAARLSKVRDERAKIETEMVSLRDTADRLAEKTVDWGEERVDIAMKPILVRLKKLQDQLADLDQPDSTRLAAGDAAAAWHDAEQRGDFEFMRAMARRAFPRLTIKPQAFYNDHTIDRIDWDGATLANATPAAATKKPRAEHLANNGIEKKHAVAKRASEAQEAKKTHRRPLTTQEHAEAETLRKQGWSITGIARQLGRDPKTIRTYLTGQKEPSNPATFGKRPATAAKKAAPTAAQKATPKAAQPTARRAKTPAGSTTAEGATTTKTPRAATKKTTGRATTSRARRKQD